MNVRNAARIINQSKRVKQLAFDYSKLIKDKERQKNELKTMKTKAHMRYLGLVTGEDDLGIVTSKGDIAAMINSLDERMGKLINEIAALEKEKQAEEDIRNNDFTWLDKLLEYGYIKELTRDITVEFVNYIYIGADKKIKIEFKYQDEYNRITEYVKRYADDVSLEGVI